MVKIEIDGLKVPHQVINVIMFFSIPWYISSTALLWTQIPNKNVIILYHSTVWPGLKTLLSIDITLFDLLLTLKMLIILVLK